MESVWVPRRKQMVLFRFFADPSLADFEVGSVAVPAKETNDAVAFPASRLSSTPQSEEASATSAPNTARRQACVQ
jgi:hypothetical protein